MIASRVARSPRRYHAEQSRHSTTAPKTPWDGVGTARLCPVERRSKGAAGLKLAPKERAGSDPKVCVVRLKLSGGCVGPGPEGLRPGVAHNQVFHGNQVFLPVHGPTWRWAWSGPQNRFGSPLFLMSKQGHGGKRAGAGAPSKAVRLGKDGAQGMPSVLAMFGQAASSSSSNGGSSSSDVAASGCRSREPQWHAIQGGCDEAEGGYFCRELGSKWHGCQWLPKW